MIRRPEPELVRVIVWGCQQWEAELAADQARELARFRDWHIVALTQLHGGKASEQLARAARDAHGPLIHEAATYDRVIRAYEAPMTKDPANDAALIRWARGFR